MATTVKGPLTISYVHMRTLASGLWVFGAITIFLGIHLNSSRYGMVAVICWLFALAIDLVYYAFLS
jgi:hypothetical protein